MRMVPSVLELVFATAIGCGSVQTMGAQAIVTKRPTSLCKVVVAPDLQSIACMDLAGGIDVVRVDNPGAKRELHTGQSAFEVGSCAFSADGSALVASSEGGRIRLWNAKTWSHIADWAVHDVRVTTLCFSPDGSLLATADVAGRIRLWSVDAKLSERKLVAELERLGDSVSDITFSRNGKLLAAGSAGFDRAVRIWQHTDSFWILKHKMPTESVERVVFSRNGQFVVSAGRNIITRWDVARGVKQASYDAGSHGIHDVTASPDDKYLISCRSDGAIQLLDAARCEVLHDIGRAESPWCLALRGDERHLIIGCLSGRVHCWKLDDRYRVVSSGAGKH